MSIEHPKSDSEFRIHCSDAVDLVTEFLDDNLSRSDLAAFQTHLEGCEACSVFVDQIEMTVKLISATKKESAVLMPANFDDLLRALTEQAEKP